MIRINLLTVDRERRKKKLPGFGTPAQKLTVACSIISWSLALLMRGNCRFLRFVALT